MHWGTAASIAALLGIASSGCSLVLDFSERADAGVAPRCAASEPNETAATAPLLAQGTNELALCGDDIDFFTLDLAANTDLVITTSSTSDVNLELSLFLGTNTIQVSDAEGPAEVIERTNAMDNRLEAGEYKIRVQSVPAGQEGDYDLVLELTGDLMDAGVDAS